MHDNPSTSVILGFDFGMRRIGVAIGNTLTSTAHPLTTLDANDGIPNWQEIIDLTTHWNANELVVGLPLSLTGEPQEITHAAKKFSNRLRQKCKLPVHLIDERYTTKVGRMEQKKGQQIDSVAASVILQAHLNEQKTSKKGGC